MGGSTAGLIGRNLGARTSDWRSSLPGNDCCNRVGFAFRNLAVKEKSLPVVRYCILIHPSLVSRREAKTGCEERLRSAKFNCSTQVHRNRHYHSLRCQVEQLSPVASPVWDQTALV